MLSKRVRFFWKKPPPTAGLLLRRGVKVLVGSPITCLPVDDDKTWGLSAALHDEILFLGGGFDHNTSPFWGISLTKVVLPLPPLFGVGRERCQKDVARI